MSIREVVEGKQTQGEDEEIAYTVNTQPVGGSPVVNRIQVKDKTQNWKDVTEVTMPDPTSSVAGHVITLPVLKALTRDHGYRVEVLFQSAGQVLECYVDVDAER